MSYVLLIFIVFLIIPLIISLALKKKFTLVPAVYMNYWVIFMYLCFFALFILAILFTLNGYIDYDRNLLIMMGIALIYIIINGVKLLKSIVKAIKLRSNKSLLLTGTKIEVDNLNLKTYRLFKGHYFGWVEGTYYDKNGKECIFISEDYLANHYRYFKDKYSNIKKVDIYIDPNDEKKFYYKAEDFK